MARHRLHVVNLAHTAANDAYGWCAFSQKARRFSRMMTERGHHVTVYGHPNDDVQCSGHVVCGWDLPENGVIPPFNADEPIFQEFNQRAIHALATRLQPHDFICLIGGLAQKPIADAYPNHMAVEYGIGYGGVFANYRVFESLAWMHTVYGAQSGGDAHSIDGRFFDAVIPNYFDTDAFPQGRGDGGYLLFVGRLIDRKGIQIAVDTAKAADRELIVAGAGDPPDDCTYVGVVGPRERAELMGGALALLAPSLYVEPFCGVAVEAQLTGTPVICTDWGAMTETVEDGVTGFRCHTMREFIDAVDSAGDLDRHYIRQRAVSRYSLEAVAPMYEDYFARLSTLWGSGFYEGVTAPHTMSAHE